MDDTTEKERMNLTRVIGEDPTAEQVEKWKCPKCGKMEWPSYHWCLNCHIDNPNFLAEQVEKKPMYDLYRSAAQKANEEFYPNGSRRSADTDLEAKIDKLAEEAANGEWGESNLAYQIQALITAAEIRGYNEGYATTEEAYKKGYAQGAIDQINAKAKELKEDN